MKYRVDDIDSEEFEVEEARVVSGESKDRRFLLRFVAWTFVIFLAASAIYGVWADGGNAKFEAFSSVWTGSQGLVGVIIGYYFGKNQ